MNIFWLDTNVQKCAAAHCDKHVCKMIVEYAQILSTVCRSRGDDSDCLYGATHVNHPCTKWAHRQSNFNCLYLLLDALLTEYHVRWGKVHKTASIIYDIYQHVDFPTIRMTSPPLCMPAECKINGGETLSDVVECYRNYYIRDKARFAKWKHTSPPDWWPST